MPYELPLPKALKPWKVKIFDNELLIEEPHVTIIFKMERWRLGLRTKRFLDDKPKPGNVPKLIMTLVTEKLETLCQEWDARFPTNPVAPLEAEEE
jgi:hypothetical protein